MFSLKSLGAALIALVCATSANALTWTWSMAGGTEAGTFTTDGDVLGGDAGIYTITGLTWDQSSVVDLGELTGAFDVAVGGAQTMVWDGVAATQFTRFNGAYTNGSNFYIYDADIGDFTNVWIGFFGTGGIIADTDYNPYGYQNDLSIALAAPAAVPLPASLPLAAAALGALGMVARRKRAA